MASMVYSSKPFLMGKYRMLIAAALILAASFTVAVGQDLGQTDTKAKAELIIRKAVQQLGGDKYLQIKSTVGKGTFSVLRQGGVVSYQKFVDIIAFPDRERTEFKGGGSRTIQVNAGSTGWIYDDELETIRQQTAAQVENFKRGMRTSLDNVLRGYWRGQADLSYVGRRPATLGKRNDVIKLTYKDGFIVEFEFADDGLPQKALYKRKSVEGDDIKEEDRYAQFIESNGIRSPMIIDRLTDGHASSRINYETIEYNRTIPDAIFAKPATAKEAKKGVKF